jgi:excinuclease ABC subunit A
VPDPNLTIHDRALAAWPPARQVQNLGDILVTLGYEVERPWRKMARKPQLDSFTEEQPITPVYAGWLSMQAPKSYPICSRCAKAN